MALETLFLDAGGVLVHPNWERVAKSLSARGIEIDAAELGRQAPYVMHELDRPQPANRHDARDAHDDESRGLFLFHRVLERSGVARSSETETALAEVQSYHDQLNLWDVVPPEVPEALRSLQDSGLRLVVVSNANATLERMLDRQGLAGYFDVIIDSAVVGVEKPDPKIFEIALERSGAHPSTVAHVGDLFQVDVVGARSAGLAAALIDGAGLYPDVDCPRFRDLADLAHRVEELATAS